MTISSLSSIGAAGMHRAADRLEASASRVARFGTGLGDVDMVSEMVEVLQAQTDFTAATKIVRVADKMTRSTLDILA